MDRLTALQRSELMSKIKSSNTKFEKGFFKILKNKGVRFKKHYKITGTPDIVIVEKKIAIFLDSDFWHGWKYDKWKLKLKSQFWRDKIERNIKRDLRTRGLLRLQGWKVLRVWEHQIKSKPDIFIVKLLGLLGNK